MGSHGRPAYSVPPTQHASCHLISASKIPGTLVSLGPSCAERHMSSKVTLRDRYAPCAVCFASFQGQKDCIVWCSRGYSDCGRAHSIQRPLPVTDRTIAHLTQLFCVQPTVLSIPCSDACIPCRLTLNSGFFVIVCSTTQYLHRKKRGSVYASHKAPVHMVCVPLSQLAKLLDLLFRHLLARL